MHYEVEAGAEVRHSVLDVDVGYMLAPTSRGVQLTTGAEIREPRRAADAGPARPL